MVSNYIRFALRTIFRNRMYSFINVLGLTLGISACISIFVITRYEFSFDDFHPDHDNIYRITGAVEEDEGRVFYTEDIPPPAPAAFRGAVRGVDAISCFYPYRMRFSIQDADHQPRHFTDKADGNSLHSTIFTDSGFFTIFPYEWLAGHPSTSLNAPSQLVMSATLASKYFNTEHWAELVGREVIGNDSLRLTVSGIVKDRQRNTDFGYSSFVSLSTINTSFLKQEMNTGDWRPMTGNPWPWSFVKLSRYQAASNVEAQMNRLLRDKAPIEPLHKFSLKLQPLSDVHFNADYDHDGLRKAHAPTLRAIIGIALSILLLASINFINLSTARSMQRTREIGIRKVVGGSRMQLVWQFLTEGFVITLFAVMIALLLAQPLLTGFHQFVPPGLVFPWGDPLTWTFVVMITIITTLLAGWYPARVASSYSTSLSLQGEPGKNTRGGIIRKVLIVFQFTVSLIFIISTVVVVQQLRFMQYSDMGFETDAIVLIHPPESKPHNLKVLVQDIERLPGVKKAIVQGKSPLLVQTEIPVRFKGASEKELLVSLQAGNESFIRFYRMRLLAGRNLPPADGLAAFVINETLCRKLGFDNPRESIGELLYTAGKAVPVVGVIADIHEGSFHERIRPMVIGHMPAKENRIAVKLMPANDGSTTRKVVLNIEQSWKLIYPSQPFGYDFLDESIARLYEKEQQTALLMKTAMIITIILSCMGLLGLIMFMAAKRAKEIAIRKVLGATITDIIGLLSKDFLILVLIASLIAGAIAYHFMSLWLQNFAYRTRIGLGVLFLSGTAALLLVSFTIGLQAVRSARANPVHSLKKL